MSESNRSREILKSFGTSLVVVLVTLVALEVVLRLPISASCAKP
ncbi:MAG: hypothetical protein AB7I42_15960 [Bradyrhizobium sp.]